ncbi:hypothetical protein, partial [Coprococcus sp. AM11-30B]|uniref:hypothetical protein n=1 Tax=Coprococcus sp. AM11-30B TaxID=2997950 RepID=UPI0022E85E76
SRFKQGLAYRKRYVLTPASLYIIFSFFQVFFYIYSLFMFLHTKKECAEARSRAERVAERQWRSLSNDRSGA